jgi:hypothetical protein
MLRQLIDAADAQLRAMILLAVNCGFGSHDCATLPVSAIDADGGWIDYPRPRRASARRQQIEPPSSTLRRRVTAADSDDFTGDTTQ